MFESKQTPGFEIIEKAISDIETIGSYCIPSLNHLLDYKGFYVTKDDIRALRVWLKERKYKLIRVTDYAIVKRGKKK
jgi:hypothetical protein